MSRLRLFLIILISILLVGGSITIWALATGDDDEEKIPLSDVPAKVLEAANSQVPGGEVIAVEREVEKGEMIYDVEKIVDGVTYEIGVTADGIVKEVEKEGEDDDKEEEEIALSDVPAKVLEAAKKAVPDGKLMEVEMEDENGEMLYEVEMVVRYEVKVAANGEVKEVEIEKEDDDED